jgi:hypothetical protein
VNSASRLARLNGFNFDLIPEDPAFTRLFCELRRGPHLHERAVQALRTIVRGHVEHDEFFQEGVGLQAFIGMSMSGIALNTIRALSEQSDIIASILGAMPYGFDVYQPESIMSPVHRPVKAYDREHVRRMDIGHLVRSDLVVVLLPQPSTGIGTVTAWAERVGALQLVFAEDSAAKSPLATGSPTIWEIGPLDFGAIARMTKGFLERHIEAIRVHHERRRRRIDTHTDDLARLRKSLHDLGERELERRAPAWMPLNLLVETVSSANHYAAATYEQRETLDEVLQEREPPWLGA